MWYVHGRKQNLGKCAFFFFLAVALTGLWRLWGDALSKSKASVFKKRENWSFKNVIYNLQIF